MSSQSAFEKRYVDPKDKSNVEGLLEHFNLPPKAIAFLRRYKRPIQAGLIVLFVCIVGFSLYDSYRENRIDAAASALALAVDEAEAGKRAALENVAKEYANTTSGIWARVELAHVAMAEKNYAEAAGIYGEVNKEVKKINPLFGLTLFGQARAFEADGKFDEALAAFEGLKDVEGYRYTGYIGMARILEAQGEIDKALGIYGQYQTVIEGEEGAEQQKAAIEERMALLRSKK